MMLSEMEVLEMQRAQHRHDRRNHSDILYLHKNERLKHYGLHYSKYVGRLARTTEIKPVIRTLVDTILVTLSAANTLHYPMSCVDFREHEAIDNLSYFISYAEAAGRFADACEKIDHQEEFVSLAKIANQDIFSRTLIFAHANGHKMSDLMLERRKELADRQFFIRD